MLQMIEEPIARVKRKKEFALTERQEMAQEVIGGQQTHTCLVGGARSGKTFVIVRTLVIRALHAPESRHLLARLHGNAIRASVWLDTFPKVMRLCFPHIETVTRRQDGYEELPNGSQLWFGGLDEDDRTEKLLGLEYATIYVGECSQVPYSSILLLRTRLAQSDTGLKLRALYDLNPASTRHWTNLEFGDKLDPITRVPLTNPKNFRRLFMNPEDNAANLDPEYLESLRALPTAFKQRFYEGKYRVDIDGALWSMDLLEANRVEAIEPGAPGRKLGEFVRIGVGVDPSGAQSKLDIKSDETGIVVVGRRHDKTAVVLEDATVRGSPKDWGRRVVAMYKKWRADFVIAESNFGGAMVSSTIKAVDQMVPVRLVHASRGKVIRAEPVAALYEENKIAHAGRFMELEEQLLSFSKFGYKGDRSPDRADALIWAASELMLEKQSTYTLEHVH